MTPEQFITKLQNLRDQYAIDTDNVKDDDELHDSITDTYWTNETDAWADYLGHPVTKPRPRPRG